MASPFNDQLEVAGPRRRRTHKRLHVSDSALARSVDADLYVLPVIQPEIHAFNSIERREVVVTHLPDDADRPLCGRVDHCGDTPMSDANRVAIQVGDAHRSRSWATSSHAVRVHVRSVCEVVTRHRNLQVLSCNVEGTTHPRQKMEAMTTDRHGAVRAAALLELLQGRTTPLPQRAARQLLTENDLDELPNEPESFRLMLDRAIDDLRAWGVDVQTQGGTLSIAPPASDRATARFMSITVEQDRLRRRIGRAIRALDPSYRVDEGHLLKLHIPADRLSFVYGPEERTLEGIPYRMTTGERPWLFVRTVGGDVAIRVDAIRAMQLLVVNEHRVGDGSPTPQQIEAPPVVRTGWRQRRGRPTDPMTLRTAQRVAASIRRLAIDKQDGAGCHISLAELRHSVGVTKAQLDRLERVIQLIDPDITFSDTDCFLDVTVPGGAAALNGAEALMARIELAAVLALGVGAVELDPEFSESTLRSWESDLDEFLSCAELAELVPDAPWAKNVIVAALDGYDLSVRLSEDPSAWHSLAPTQLQWTKHQWRILGVLDGQRVGEGGLAISSVVEVRDE